MPHTPHSAPPAALTAVDGGAALDEVLAELRALEIEEEKVKARAADIAKRRRELLGLQTTNHRQPSIKSVKQSAQEIINQL